MRQSYKTVNYYRVYIFSKMEVQFMIDTIYARAVVELAKEKGLDLR